MIFDLTQMIATRMPAKLAKINRATRAKIFFGHERLTDEIPTDNKIQVLYSGADRYEYAKQTAGQQTTTGFHKYEGVRVVITGKETKPGASENMHKRLVRTLADMFMVLWLQVAHAKGCSVQGIKSGFVDVEGQEETIGAKYVITFENGRGLPGVDEQIQAANQQATATVTAEAPGQASETTPGG